MQGTKQCPQCGTQLPPDAPEGNCPTCLVRLGLTVDVGETPPPVEMAEGVHSAKEPPLEGGDLASAPSQDLVDETKHIGQYVVLNKLGQGGTGEVWLGYDSGLERHVAIKVLKAQLQTETDQAAGFMQEARTAAALSHPNVVTVFQVGQHAGRFFIAMEYLPRGSLQDELNQRGRLDYRAATLIIRDAVCGLWAAHEAGIVHRDVKPGNLLRAENGMTKVADFGMARLAVSSGTPTHSGKIYGTPSYIAPEQVRGGALDARTDLYSLTCTYYALLTGHSPFARPGEKVTPDVLLQRHVHDPFPDAQEEVPELPAGIVAILRRGSQKDPAERYASAPELYQDLERVLSDSQSEPAVASGQPQARVKMPEAATSAVGRVAVGTSGFTATWKKLIVLVTTVGLLILVCTLLVLMMRKPVVDKAAPARRLAPRQTTFADIDIQWVQPDEQGLAAAKAARVKKLEGLTAYSWETIAGKLFPDQMGELQTWVESNFELPERFILTGTLAAVRVVEGKTWVGMTFGGKTLTVLVVFDQAEVAEQMVDYSVGDAIRAVVVRSNIAKSSSGFRSREAGFERVAGVEGLAVVTRELRLHEPCFYRFTDGGSCLCFKGEALDKPAEPLSWIDASRGRIRKPANVTELARSPGVVFRDLPKWLGKTGLVRATYLRAQPAADGLRVFLVVTNSLEGPLFLQLALGNEAQVEEFQDYAPGDRVIAEVFLRGGRVDEAAVWSPDWARPVLQPAGAPSQMGRGGGQHILTNACPNPLTAWNGILADCTRLEKVDLPATRITAKGPRRKPVPALAATRPATNATPPTPAGKEILVTGTLTWLFATDGEAHCVVATEQPRSGAVAYEACTRQPGFMKATADYLSNQERRRNGDIVRIRGVLWPGEAPTFRLAKEAVLLSLREIERVGDPGSRVVAGQPRALETMQTNRIPSSLMQILRDIPPPGTEVKFSGFFYDVCYDGRVNIGPGEGLAYGSVVASRPVVPIRFPNLSNSVWSDYEDSEARVQVVAVVRPPVLPIPKMVGRRNSRDMRVVFSRRGAVPELEGKSITRWKNPKSLVTAQGRAVPPLDLEEEMRRWEGLSLRSFAPLSEPPPSETVRLEGRFLDFERERDSATIRFDHLFHGFNNATFTCTNLPPAAERFLYELERGEEILFEVRVFYVRLITRAIQQRMDLLWLARVSDPDERIAFSASQDTGR